MSNRDKIEYLLGGLLEDLQHIEDMSDVLVVKAKLECLRIAADALAKMKSTGQDNQMTVSLPDFEPR